MVMSSNYHPQQVNTVLNRSIIECWNMLSVCHNILNKSVIEFDNALVFSASTWAAVHTTQLVSPSHCPSPDTALSLGSMDKLHPFNNQPDATVHYD